MSNGQKERRKFPRMEGRFVIRYRIYGNAKIEDITQARDFSLGGMFLTTNKDFPKGTLLEVEIQLPVTRSRLNLIGKVIHSKEKVKNVLYETRLEFIDIEREDLKKG